MRYETRTSAEVMPTEDQPSGAGPVDRANISTREPAISSCIVHESSSRLLRRRPRRTMRRRNDEVLAGVSKQRDGRTRR